MGLQILFLFALSFNSFYFSSCDDLEPSNPPKDICQNPENDAQARLLSIVDECSTKSQDCLQLSDCLSENLVNISEENMLACKKAASEGNKPKTGFRPCSVAATAYVILEQIRLLLIEKTVYSHCPQIKGLFDQVLKLCGGEEGEKYLSEPRGEPDLNDMMLQEIFAKFLVSIGKKMQTYEIVREDIAELERSKHMKALGAMCVSFALPGLLGLCEASHFRTGLVLQILALFVIGIYQFSRYGGYWAFVGVGSCLLIMAIEMALLILVKKKLFGEKEEEQKKSE